MLGRERAGGDLPYLAEARRLYGLLTDGAKPAGFHIRDGYWLRDASTKRLLYSSYTSDWRPARDVRADGSHEARKLTSYHLSYHLRGKYSVAWTAPSWTSLLVLDIDRPSVPADADVDAHWRADTKRDEVLAAVWDAFGCDEDKQPVVLATPGGGYHLYFPLSRTGEPGERERTWPAAWAREWFEHQLDRAGLALRPGVLELYPSGVRLRAPCGRGTALLVPRNPNHSDDLRLEPIEAQVVSVVDGKTGQVTRSFRRRIGPMVSAFCDAIDQARRPMERWLGTEERAWSPTWGPFGDRAPKKSDACSQGLLNLFQHKEDVPSSGPQGPLSESSPQSGWLLRGAAFRARIRSLVQDGLTDPGTRHDAALKLAWHLGVVEGQSRESILDQLREWLLSHPHASATRERGESAFVRETLREVANYYDTRISKVERWRGRTAPRLLGQDLAEADKRLVERLVLAEARTPALAVLRHIKAFALENNRVPLPLELGGKLLSEICGDGRISVENPDGSRSRRRAYVVALEELERLGLLVMHTNYSVGHHGRRYTCWYEFGSGVAPRETDSGARELATRPVEEGELVLEYSADERAVMATIRQREGPDRDTPSTQGRKNHPWWARMYARRAYVPADFFVDGGRTLLSRAGPFRHRFAENKRVPPRGQPPPPMPSNSNVDPSGAATEKHPRTHEPSMFASDRGLRDAIAKAWAAFEDSS